MKATRQSNSQQDTSFADERYDRALRDQRGCLQNVDLI